MKIQKNAVQIGKYAFRLKHILLLYDTYLIIFINGSSLSDIDSKKAGRDALWKAKDVPSKSSILGCFPQDGLLQMNAKRKCIYNLIGSFENDNF